MQIQVNIATLKARQQLRQLDMDLRRFRSQVNGTGMGGMANTLNKSAIAQQRFSTATNNTSRGFRGFNRGIESSIAASGRLGNQIQWTGRQLQYNFAIPLALVAGAAVKGALDQERAMVRVRKVYGDATHGAQFYSKELKALERNFTALSNKFGVHREEVIGIAGDWAAAGASGASLARDVDLTLKAMVLGELEAKEATESLIAIQAQYGVSTKELTNIVADLNMVENQTGVTMGDLIVGMSRSAAVARTVGVSHKELAAFIALLVPATGSAATAGNGLKTMLTRIMAPTNEAADAMENMGIKVYDAGWQSLSATERIKRMAKGYETLSGAQQIFVSDLVAGKWQLAKFSQMMETVNDEQGFFNKAIESLKKPKDVIKQLNRELQAVLSSNPQKFKQSMVIMQNAIADVMIPLLPYIVAVTQWITNLAKAFSNLNPYAQGAVLALLTLLLVIGPLLRYMGASITLFKTLGIMAGGAAAGIVALGRSMLGLGGASAAANAALATSAAAGGAAQVAATIAAQSKIKQTWLIHWSYLKRAAAAYEMHQHVQTAGFYTRSTAGVHAYHAQHAKASVGFYTRMANIMSFGLGRGHIIENTFMVKSRLAWMTYWMSLNTLQAKAGTRAVIAQVAANTGIAATFVKLFKMLRMIVVRGLAMLVGFWPIALASILLAIWHFRDELKPAWDRLMVGLGQSAAALPEFFAKVVSSIIKAFNALPRGVRDAMVAVAKVVHAAAMKVYELFSYLNPFARHSPSLVDSVTGGMAEIKKQYASVGNVGALFGKAARDLAAFKSASAGLGGGEFDDKRADVKTAFPKLVPMFDSMVSSVSRLQTVLNSQEAAIARQEGVVNNWEKALNSANQALDVQEDKLDGLQDKLSALKDMYSAHEDALNGFASAPIAGMRDMEDQIFSNEMAQKKLRLEMMQWEQANGSIDSLRDRLAMLQGDLEMTRGEAATLRQAGAGSDVLGPIEGEIAAIEAQYKATEDAMKNNPISKMQDELDKLQTQSEILDLEKSLQFDPQIRAIEQLANAQKELTYEEIIAGINKERAAMAALQPQIDAATLAVEKQEDAVKAATAARDQVEQAYDSERAKLELLNDEYQRTADLLGEIRSALNDVGSNASQFNSDMESAKREKEQAAKSAAGAGKMSSLDKFNAAAVGDFPDVGGDLGIGREGGIGDQSAEIDKMTEDLNKEIAKMFTGFDFFGPIKRGWNKTWAWIEESVGPVIGPIILAIKDIWAGLFDHRGIDMSRVVEKIKKDWEKIKDIFDGPIEVVKSIFRLFGPSIVRIFREAWDGIVDMGKELGREFKQWGKLWDPLVEAARIAWDLIVIAVSAAVAILLPIVKVGFEIIGSVIGPIFDMISGVITNAFQFIRGVIEVFLAAVTGDWSLAWDGLADIVQGAFGAVWAIIKGVGKIIWGVVEGVVRGIYEFFVWLYDELVGHSIIPDMMKKILEWFQWLITPVKNALEAVWKGISWTWENVAKPIFKFMGDGIKGWALIFKWVWENVIKPVWTALWTGIKWTWENVAKPLIKFMGDGIKGWALIFQWIWTNVIKPAWSALWTGVKWTWDNVVKPLIKFMGDGIKGWALIFQWIWTNVIKPAWSALWTGVKWTWDNVARPFIGGMVTAIKAFAGVFGWIWGNVIKPAWDLLWKNLDAGWNKIGKPVFEKIVGGITKIVNGAIRAINGIGNAIEKVAGVVGVKINIPNIPDISAPKFAKGGILPTGVGPGFMTNVPRAIVGEGGRHPEYVIPTDPKYRDRASALLKSANDAIGGPLDDGLNWGKKALGGAADFVLNPLGSDIFRGSASKVFDLAMKGVSPMISSIPVEFIRGYVTTLRDSMSDWIKGVDKALPEEGSMGSLPVEGSGWSAIEKWLEWKGGDVKRIITSTQRFGSGGSLHNVGRAIDYSVGGHNNGGYNSSGLRAIFNALLPIGGNLAELILAGAPFNIKNGKKVPGYAWGTPGAPGNHWNHVHAALAAGGILDKGPVMSLMGEAGTEVVSPLAPLWARFDRLEKLVITQSRGGGGDVTININGNLEFPNISSGSDASEFIRNLEVMARG